MIAPDVDADGTDVTGGTANAQALFGDGLVCPEKGNPLDAGAGLALLSRERGGCAGSACLTRPALSRDHGELACSAGHEAMRGNVGEAKSMMRLSFCQISVGAFLSKNPDEKKESHNATKHSTKIQGW